MNQAETYDQISLTNQRIGGVINDLKFLTEARITYTNTQLVKYIELLYQKACYNYLRGMFHASPGFWAILVAIWGVIVAIYNGIKFVIDLLHIKEILEIASVLRIIWPEFRRKYDEILGKISDFSRQIGWGADGIIHLIQAAQGGLNILKGVTGKSYEWLQVAGAEKALRALQFVSGNAFRVADDPAYVLDIAFKIPYEETSREVKTWWDKTVSWLTDTSQKAEEAVIKVNDTIDNLMELHNSLPQFVRDHIPSEITDGLFWVDSQIDNTILPALTAVSKEFATINTELQAQRDRASNLAAMLAHPGDLLLSIDDLDEETKNQQELLIDDVASRILNEEADSAEAEDSEIIKYLDSIMGLLTIPVTPPVYTKIETMPSPVIVWDEAEKIDKWFVGDY